MSFKLNKVMTTHLIKFVRKIEIHFNPIDARTTSVRELWRQVTAARFEKANPNMKVTIEMVQGAAHPTAKVELVDGTKMNFEGQKYHCKEILEAIYMKASQLDIELELEGKSIDDIA
mmetsp:Transcript_22339/g.25410  ORF Transcript_22339/g.25410 Transcript_22339/m.25410 type:complete len:117 (+) Transcript_22339:161-511(+)|eukprot:CAMPEP_0194146678 /NCGR_PEP_ID=MMETSP0152-20130528/21294_1 /TAXON_ID=1049557 /ORGANISM="Thalassiothrix antarctica, Strain L6-D1" /LENGTH=116 /DNA_ID=CAMNT_0038847251 /DNA_START=110 /DNA_END=460 /DNA_ORIENTATION=+